MIDIKFTTKELLEFERQTEFPACIADMEFHVYTCYIFATED